MSRVTTKLQVTIPKAIALEYEISPGSDVEFQEAGEVIRLLPPRALRRTPAADLEQRLAMFDALLQRQLERNQAFGAAPENGSDVDRGWTREELYDRAVPR